MNPDELPQLDTPPTSGVFVEHHDLRLTPEEAEQGDVVGSLISVEDDDDNGLDIIAGFQS